MSENHVELLYASQSFSRDRCFLCGTELSSATQSLEHVIPRWAQDRFDLWNQRLGLLNGTLIRYHALVTPCCRTCNNSLLSPIEDRVRGAFEQGPDAVRQLGKVPIFLWLSKLFYGLLHRELFLSSNRRDPRAPNITSPEILGQLKFFYLLLQAARYPMRLDPVPASILVYETQTPTDRRLQWDFRDNLFGLFIAVRAGRVGIVAALQDGGAQQPVLDRIIQDLPQPLHPIQHLELAAKVSYAAAIMNRVPKFMTVDGPSGIDIVQFPLLGFSARPLFDSWDEPEYAEVLAAYTGRPLAVVHQPGVGTETWLHDASGMPRYMSMREFPWS